MEERTEAVVIPEVTVAREKKEVIGTLVATEDWWVTFDHGKEQIRKMLVAVGIKPATFIPKSASGGKLIMKLPDGSTVVAERKVGAVVNLIKWEV
jgi:hypothetical protein